MIDFASEIRNRITMRECLERYGIEINRAGFVRCPFHQGDKTPSLKVYPNNRGWNCFGCGESGSVIDFTMRYFDEDFKSACDRLNNDFALGLPFGRKPTLREQRDAEKRHRELIAERTKAEAKKQAYDSLYNALWGEFARLDINRRLHAPKSMDDELHPLYVEAVTNISHVEHRIDTLL